MGVKFREGIKERISSHIRDKKGNKHKPHRKYKRDPAIEYEKMALLEIASSKKDPYSIMLILDITRNIFDLSREITKYPVLHPEMIASGMVWKAIQHLYFSLTQELKKYNDIPLILKYATFTLKNLVSFAAELSEKGVESFTFKNLTKETEKGIMYDFWQAIQRMFGEKIRVTLYTKYAITNQTLLFSG